MIKHFVEIYDNIMNHIISVQLFFSTKSDKIFSQLYLFNKYCILSYNIVFDMNLKTKKVFLKIDFSYYASWA